GITSVVLVGLVALISLAIMGKELNGYNRLLENEVAALSSVENAVTQYKVQIQHWKDVLLSAQEIRDREQHWQAFEKNQQELQGKLSLLLSGNLPLEVSNYLRGFQSSHRNIFPKYQQAYSVFERS